MKSKEELIRMIEWRKKEVNLNGMNQLDLSAKDYADIATAENICGALKYCMLEGDTVIEGNADNASVDLKVRYYCDNLSESRRRIYA